VSSGKPIFSLNEIYLFENLSDVVIDQPFVC